MTRWVIPHPLPALCPTRASHGPRGRRMAKRETHQAERDARLSEGMARRGTEAAKRETRLIVTIAGLIVGAVAFLGFLIRWPF